MTTDIQLLRSSVASKRPALAPLLDGQAAVNINSVEPGLYFRNSAGTALIKIGPVAISTDGSAPNSSPAGSTGNSIGETWLDGRTSLDSPVLKVWDGSSWETSNGFTVNDTSGAFSLSKLLTVKTLESDGTGADSYLRLPQDDNTARASISAEQGMIRFNTDSSLYEGYDGTSWNTFVSGSGSGGFEDLTATGDTILGDDCANDTLTINSVTTLNCNATIGANNTNTLSLVSLINTDVTPDGNGTRSLGSSTASWNVFAVNLTATGNTSLGDDAAADTVSITAELTQNGVSNLLDNTTLWDTKQLRFSTDSTPSSGASYVSFSPPTGLSAPVNLVLPDSVGTNGQGLITDGSGNLSWGTPALPNNITINDLTVEGDAVIGDSCLDDSLTVNATTTINCDVTIGDASTDSLSIVSGVATNILPLSDNTVNLGSATQRWANVYTGDLHLANERGDWTMVEEEDYLSLRNNKTGKIFKLVMEAID